MRRGDRPGRGRPWEQTGHVRSVACDAPVGGTADMHSVTAGEVPRARRRGQVCEGDIPPALLSPGFSPWPPDRPFSQAPVASLLPHAEDVPPTPLILSGCFCAFCISDPDLLPTLLTSNVDFSLGPRTLKQTHWVSSPICAVSLPQLPFLLFSPWGHSCSLFGFSSWASHLSNTPQALLP